MSERGFLRVGLTGGIGAGKSTVSGRLKALGALVIDADETARAVVEPGTQGLTLVAGAFGKGVLQPDGRLDRKALSKLVFQNEQAREALNGLLHPLIIAAMREKENKEARPGRLVVWDVPLLIEAGMYCFVDEVWLVTAKEEVRVERIRARDCCSVAEAEARLRAQMPDHEKRSFARHILDNTGDRTSLFKQTDALYHMKLGEYGGN